MAGMLAIAAAAGWLLAFFLCAVATRLPPRWADAAAPWPGLGGERPALVSLTARVTIGGSAARSLPPDALPRLAATVAERLPAHVSQRRTPE